MKRMIKSLRDWLHFLYSAAVRHTLLLPKAQPLSVNTSPTLIIAPHQDDETLGCGALIAAKLERKADVTVVYLTDGQKGRPSTVSAAEIVPIRAQEACNALAELGMPPEKIHFFNVPDGSLGQLTEEDKLMLQKRLAELIAAAKIRDVYVPFRKDGHPDHDAVATLVTDAVHLAGVTILMHQYLIWRLWWDTPKLLQMAKGSLYVFRHRYQSRKKAAMARHISQHPGLNKGFVRLLCQRYEFFVVEDPSTLTPTGR